MATSAISSHGTMLKIHDGASPGTYATIAEVLDITGPSYELGTEEVTSHDSGGWREFVPTLLDGGEITFDLNYYSATTQDSLETDQLNRSLRKFQLVAAVGGSVTDTRGFSAYVSKVELQAPVEGILKMSLTLRTTGAISKNVA